MISRKQILLALAALVCLAVAGCASPSAGQGVTALNPQTTPLANQPESTCLPTSQDDYVWSPRRLKVLKPCERALGTVTELSAAEPDGDLHIHIRLDADYTGLLTEGNQLQQNGDLVIEVVCQYVPPMILALRVCASDPDPDMGPFPQVGDHIWVEGRYVLDLWHEGMAELHPLYRWGMADK